MIGCSTGPATRPGKSERHLQANWKTMPPALVAPHGTYIPHMHTCRIRQHQAAHHNLWCRRCASTMQAGKRSGTSAAAAASQARQVLDFCGQL